MFGIYVRWNGLRAFNDQDLQQRLALTPEQVRGIESAFRGAVCEVEPPSFPRPPSGPSLTALQIRQQIAWAEFGVLREEAAFAGGRLAWDAVHQTLTDEQWVRYGEIRGSLLAWEQQSLEVAMVRIVTKSPTARRILGVDDESVNKVVESKPLVFGGRRTPPSLDELALTGSQRKKLRRITLQVEMERAVRFLDVWNLVDPTVWQAVQISVATLRNYYDHDYEYWKGIDRLFVPPGSSDDFVIDLYGLKPWGEDSMRIAGYYNSMRQQVEAIRDILTAEQREALRDEAGAPIDLIWRVRAEL